MNAEKVVKALRADLIESQAAQIASLTEQLAQSRKRVADMCSGCDFLNTVGCHCARAARRGPVAGEGEAK